MHVQKIILTFVLLLLVLPAPSLIGVGAFESKEIQVTSDSADSAASPTYAKVDVFGGRFSPQELFVEPDQVADVSFSISPTVDAPSTVIEFRTPEGFVELVKGEAVWAGDVKKGETVTLQLSVKVIGEVDISPTALVKASPQGRELSSSYPLRVSSISPEKESNEVQARLVSLPDVEMASSNLSSGTTTDGMQTADDPPGVITVDGTFVFWDRGRGTWMPARGVLVELWEYNGGSILGVNFDVKVTPTRTDYNGFFSFTVNNDEGGGDRRDPYIKVYADGWDYVTTTTYVQLFPPIGFDVADGYYPLGTIYPGANIEAWEAGDAVEAEAIWIYNWTGWWRPAKVNIDWPEGDWPSWNWAFDSIDLPANGSLWDYTVIYHEYGHAVMWRMYGENKPDGPGPSTDRHYPASESSLGFALKEGWGEFMACAVDNNPNNLWFGGMNIETNNWYNGRFLTPEGWIGDLGVMDGALIEGEVASILWDIFDRVDQPDGPAFSVGDNMSGGFGRIFRVLVDYRPSDIIAFWYDWIATYPDLPTSVGPLATIYWNYGIDEDTYYPWGSLSINGGARYTAFTNVTLGFTASDYGSGVDSMQLWGDNNLNTGWVGMRAFYRGVYLSPGDGYKYFSVQFRDRKGILSGVYVARIFLDQNPPTGSIIINGGNTYATSTNVTLTTLAFDGSGSGVAFMVIWDDRNLRGIYPYPYSVTWPFQPWDGNRTIYVMFTDRSGLDSGTYQDSIILDTAAPMGSITINWGAPYTTSTNVTLTISASDGGGSGVGSMYIWDDSNRVWWGAYQTSFSWRFLPADGQRTIYITFTDNAGLTSYYFTDWIILDTTPPTGAISINNGRTYTMFTSVVLNLTFYDATSGVWAVRYSNDPIWDITEPWEAPPQQDPDLVYRKVWNLTSGDGDKTVYYQIMDYAGLLSPVYSDSITLDTVPPTGSIIINGGAKLTNSTSVILDLEAASKVGNFFIYDVVRMLISNDGSYFFSFPYSVKRTWELSLGDGNKTVYVIFRDAAGNGSPLYSDTIVMDTTPPTGSIHINKDDMYTTSTSVTLYLKYDDAVAGVDAVRYSNVNKWDTQPWETPSNRKAWNLTQGEGQKTVYYQIRDKLGWISFTYSDTIYYTQVIPTVTSFSVKPNPFSPNGDKIKDTTTITATFNVVVDWQLQILDSGDWVQQIWTGTGNFSIVWDGTSSGDQMPDGDYKVHLSAATSSGIPTLSHMQTVTIDTIPPTVTGVSVTPSSFNPTHGETATINFTLSEESFVTIKIYSAKGLVRTLLNSHLPAGSHSITWDGRDNGHHILPAGTYTIKIYVIDNAGNPASPYPIMIFVKVIE